MIPTILLLAQQVGGGSSRPISLTEIVFFEILVSCQLKSFGNLNVVKRC
jgi:hypothetical protein